MSKLRYYSVIYIYDVGFHDPELSKIPRVSSLHSKRDNYMYRRRIDGLGRKRNGYSVKVPTAHILGDGGTDRGGSILMTRLECTRHMADVFARVGFFHLGLPIDHPFTPVRK